MKKQSAQFYEDRRQDARQNLKTCSPRLRGYWRRMALKAFELARGASKNAGR
jgi:hypothetical protein